MQGPATRRYGEEVAVVHLAGIIEDACVGSRPQTQPPLEADCFFTASIYGNQDPLARYTRSNIRMSFST